LSHVRLQTVDPVHDACLERDRARKTAGATTVSGHVRLFIPGTGAWQALAALLAS
jgi:hypothetical protein